jgi:hypothetical protein
MMRREMSHPHQGEGISGVSVENKKASVVQNKANGKDFTQIVWALNQMHMYR